MKPSLIKLKQAVAKMLPGQVEILSTDDEYFYWSDDKVRITERGWLYVCWLAEQTLTDEECRQYNELLIELRPDLKGLKCRSLRWSWGQPDNIKLEALCRVRHPKMFAD